GTAPESSAGQGDPCRGRFVLEFQEKSQGRSSKLHSTLYAQRSLTTCYSIVHRPFLHHASRRLQKASPHTLPEGFIWLCAAGS
ncbi:hypothetical protein Nmel_001001, partial [Mimus melanotis]